MNELLFSLALVVLTVALIAMSMTVKRLSEEVDELKEVVEHIRKHLDFYQLSDHEQRLDQLEEVLELKEYYEEEPLNEEENE